MFPHKYTSESHGPIIFAWLNAVEAWQKIRPLNFGVMPRLKLPKHPHANDPRVIREEISCHKYYSDIWFSTRTL